MPVCSTCKDAAFVKDEKIFSHSKCEYPSTCTCQHKVDAKYDTTGWGSGTLKT